MLLDRTQLFCLAFSQFGDVTKKFLGNVFNKDKK